MNLELKRPLAFLDLETTGINPGLDRIVEIAIVKLCLDGTRKPKRWLVNPEIAIPKSASDIHGITDEMVKNAPTFKQIANDIKNFLEQCDLGGYNSNRFDVPMLVEEFHRSGLDFKFETRKLVDVQKIFYLMEPRTLTGAFKFFCGKELANAHSALADVEATVEVLEAQLDRYPQLGNTVETILNTIGEDDVVDLARRLIRQDGKIVFNFGKYKGKLVENVFISERSYYDWMMQGDFPKDTKNWITRILSNAILKK